jgi:hypothetical protein
MPFTSFLKYEIQIIHRALHHYPTPPPSRFTNQLQLLLLLVSAQLPWRLTHHTHSLLAGTLLRT